MKLISAVIRPAAFDTVREALALFGVRGMTVGEVYRTLVRGTRVQFYRGQTFTSDLEAGLKIELMVPDDEVPDLIHIIDKIMSDADPVDGRVWITAVDLVVRVRTNEHGLDAL